MRERERWQKEIESGRRNNEKGKRGISEGGGGRERGRKIWLKETENNRE